MGGLAKWRRFALESGMMTAAPGMGLLAWNKAFLTVLCTLSCWLQPHTLSRHTGRLE